MHPYVDVIFKKKHFLINYCISRYIGGDPKSMLSIQDLYDCHFLQTASVLYLKDNNSNKIKQLYNYD